MPDNVGHSERPPKAERIYCHSQRPPKAERTSLISTVGCRLYAVVCKIMQN